MEGLADELCEKDSSFGQFNPIKSSHFLTSRYPSGKLLCKESWFGFVLGRIKSLT